MHIKIKMRSKVPSENSRFILFISFVASLGGFLFGFDTAVISGVVGFVKGEFFMSSVMEGWFVSSALLGCIIGVSTAGRLSDSYGRKITLILSAFLFTFSAIGCTLAVDETTLILFRLVGGMGIGVASMISPLYISETAPTRMRGRLVALYQLAITLGILCAYFSNSFLLRSSTHSSFEMGGFLHWIITEHVWRSMLGFAVFPSILFLILLFFLPESPRWLIIKNREKEALILLNRIVGKENSKNFINGIKVVSKVKGSLNELLSPVYRKALLIGLLLPFLAQVTGVNAVIYYGPRVLNEAGFSLGNAFSGQIIIGVVNMVFTFIAILSVDKWGRRPLLLTGACSVIVSLVVIGLLFNLDVTNGIWILLFILLFISSFAFSFGPISFIIISEIFPTSIRGRAMSICILSMWVGTFLVGQLTPTLLDGIGPAMTFWLFALLCSPTVYLVLFVIPETRGKSLEEIGTYWKEESL